MTLNFKKVPYGVLVRNWLCFLHTGWDALPPDAVPETCWLVSTSCSPPAPPGQARCETVLRPTERTGGAGLAQATHPPHASSTRSPWSGWCGACAGHAPSTRILHRQPTDRGGAGFAQPMHPLHAAHGQGCRGACPGHAPSTCTLHMHPPHAAHGQGWHGAHAGHAPSTRGPSRCP